MVYSKSYTSHLGLGLVLALGLFGSCMYVSSVFIRLKDTDKTFEVMGFNEQKISSDIVVWSGNLITRGMTLSESFGKLEADRKQVLGFLRIEDIRADQINMAPIVKDTLFKRDGNGQQTTHPEGYILRQKFTVTSGDVHKISALSVKIDHLNTEGVEFESYRPDFFFSSEKLNQVKIDLLAGATENARKSAEHLALNSRSAVGQLVTARQGIFQVTAENSSDLCEDHVYDTSTIDKVVKVFVTLSYTID